MGVSSTTWKGFFFGGATNGITGCSSSPTEGKIVSVDAVSDSQTGDLSNIYPDVKPDITDVSSWLDIFEIHPPDTQPDIVEIPPEIIEVSPDTAICVPQEEIPYDHIAQQCTLDLADVDGDGYCLKDYEIEDAALQCAAETGKYGTDKDGDTFKTESGLCGLVDCDDNNKLIYPGAPETLCDGVDYNCDGKTQNYTVIGAPKLVSDNDGFLSAYPEIAWAGDGYGVAFEDLRTSKNDWNYKEIFFAKTDGDGNKSMGDLALTKVDSSLRAWDWNGNYFALLWINWNAGVSFSRYDLNGIKIGNDTKLTTGIIPGNGAIMAWNSAGYGAVYDKIDGAYFSRIDNNGNLVGAEKKLINGKLGHPSLVWGGVGYGLSWDEDKNKDGNRELYFVKLDTEGNKISAEIEVSLDPVDVKKAIIAYNPQDNEYGIDLPPKNWTTCN